MWSGPDDSDGPWHGLFDLRRGDARVLLNLDDDDRAVTLEPDVPLVVAAAWDGVRYDGPDTLVVPATSVTVLLPRDESPSA
ncbi:hypothetical protein CBP52_05535 [Cellulomonas sp. PSBB021]|nr:hypothetical protein [Cellulomonas sp. PSBB021]ASR54664.1 hypothetical protein CBP52_05535 [Cellulomonas sp. PSBB021]